MKNIAIKVKNRKQLDKATEILKKQGLKIADRHNEQWIEEYINWAFKDNTAFVVVYYNFWVITTTTGSKK
jgi:hypothetical protein